MAVGIAVSLAILIIFLNVRDPLSLLVLVMFAAVTALLPDLDHKMSKGTDLANKAAVILSFVFVGSNTCPSNFACFSEIEKLKSIVFGSLMLIGTYFVFTVFLRPKHRGITHTLVSCFLFSVLVYLVLGFNFAVAGLIGYGSHLLADKEIKLL